MLDSAVETHRAMYRNELSISKMVSRYPPTSLDVRTGLLDSEPGAATGMTLSGPLLRLLGHPEGYGQIYPWLRALWLARMECRRRHPHHRSGDRPYWRGSLCHQAVKLVVIGGEAAKIGPLSPENAGKVLRVDRMEPLLRNTFRFIEEQIDLSRWRAERRQRETQGYGPGAVPLPQPEHHAVDGVHRQECPQCAA